MKILVTGGAGFIGSHIVDRYISLGHEVVIIDNLSTGKSEFINPKARFYKRDIRDSKIKKIFKKEKPDIVNHHAAQIDIRKSVTDPVCDAEINILGSLNIIQTCLEYNVKKIIFASSGGAVYGTPNSLPVPETHLLQPTSPYGVAKHCTENYLIALTTYAKLNYAILRYANVYGPRQNPLGEAGVCAIFINKMFNNQICTIYGHGEPIRDYVYVQDIVDINVIALNKINRAVYNLGTGIGTKVSEIHQLLQQIIGTNNKPESKPLRTGELKEIYLDCTRAKEELGWVSQINLKEGLQKTVNFFKNSTLTVD